MTPEAQILFIQSIPTILAALGTLIVIALGALTALIVAIREARKNAKVAEEKLDVIHKVTNQHLTDVTKKADDSLKEIKDLNVIVKGLQDTIKVLIERETVIGASAKRQTGELIAEVKNGGSNSDLTKRVEELIKIMEGFGEKGMPVIVPAGEPLPVKVEVVSKK